MASPAHLLLSRIFTTSEGASILRICIDRGISVEEMPGTLERHMYDWALRYLASKRSVIGAELLAHKFPTFRPADDPSMATDALIEEVRQEYMAEATNRMLLDAGRIADPQARIQHVLQEGARLQRMGSTRKTDYTFSDFIGEIILDYERMKEGGILGMYPWPWREVTDALGGIAGDDYFVFYGGEKSMKTFTLSYLISFYVQLGLRVLVYTKEMTPKRITFRSVAFMNKLPYQEFRMGQLPRELEERLYVLAQELPSMAKPPIILSGKDVVSGGDTVEWLTAKIEQHDPDIIFIDGIYLMNDMAPAGRSQADWERMMKVSRKLRDVPNQFNKPLIATTQGVQDDGDGSNKTKIAYARSVAQDATGFFRTMPLPLRSQLALLVGGAREFKADGILLDVEPCTRFDFASFLTEPEIRALRIEATAAVAVEDNRSRARGAGAQRRRIDARLNDNNEPEES